MQKSPQVSELTGLPDDRTVTVSLTGCHSILHCLEQGNTGNNKVRRGFISVTLGNVPKRMSKGGEMG